MLIATLNFMKINNISLIHVMYLILRSRFVIFLILKVSTRQRFFQLDVPRYKRHAFTYRCASMLQLKNILRVKRRGKITKEVLFLHDSAPAHRALATQKKLAYLGFQCLDHPPYSPDLASSDYHLFPGLKQQLKGHHFSTRRSLLPRRPGWTDNLLNFFWVACKS